MNSRKLAGVSAASVGAATAVVALLLGTVSGNAGEGDPRASAFGLASDGLLPIDPTPYVEAPPDDRKTLLEVPGPDDDLIHIALLKVEAEAFRSKATAVDVDLLGISADLIEARCDHGRGDSSILGGEGDGNGRVLPSNPATGQELDLSPILRIEFNRQHRDRDRLTVDALVVSLLPGDNAGLAIADKDLLDLKKVAPNLNVPTSVDQMQQQRASSSSQQPAPGPVTVADLASQLLSLNKSLTPKQGSGALLEIVVSSASCADERKKEEPPAPAPKPVEADLPVTH
ncbi:MAG: hypothetical protein ACRDSR_24450 [Pseudonocardiaceae bacterium]